MCLRDILQYPHLRFWRFHRPPKPEARSVIVCLLCEKLSLRYTNQHAYTSEFSVYNSYTILGCVSLRIDTRFREIITLPAGENRFLNASFINSSTFPQFSCTLTFVNVSVRQILQMCELLKLSRTAWKSCWLFRILCFSFYLTSVVLN